MQTRAGEAASGRAMVGSPTTPTTFGSAGSSTGCRTVLSERPCAATMTAKRVLLAALSGSAGRWSVQKANRRLAHAPRIARGACCVRQLAAVTSGRASTARRARNVGSALYHAPKSCSRSRDARSTRGSFGSERVGWGPGESRGSAQRDATWSPRGSQAPAPQSPRQSSACARRPQARRCLVCRQPKERFAFRRKRRRTARRGLPRRADDLPSGR